MTDLPHVASRLYGTPLLIARAKLDVILSALGPRLAGKTALAFDGDPMTLPTMEVSDSGIAIVPVIGTLVSRSGYLGAASGLTAYGDIADAIEAAATDPAVRAILLDIDSPGGEVGGLFDLVDHIGAVSRECGKPLWAVAHEGALSAAYAIASAADRLYVTRTGEVGSVGVVAVHVDESAADAMAGLKWTLIHAGARKTDGNPHEPLSPAAFADIQADVDALYEDFVALVARNRGLTPAAVRGTEAAIYRGQRGIDAGFADRIGTVAQALADLAADLDAPRSHPPGNAPSPARRSFAMTTEPESLSPTEEQPEGAPLAPPEPARSEAMQAEDYAEIATIAGQAARLGVAVDAAEAIRAGTRPEALRRSVLDALASHAEATAVLAAAPPPATTGDSPIVRRARERAASRA